MSKVMRLSVAVVVSLALALTLLTGSVFAQTLKTSNSSATHAALSTHQTTQARAWAHSSSANRHNYLCYGLLYDWYWGYYYYSYYYC